MMIFLVATAMLVIGAILGHKADYLSVWEPIGTIIAMVGGLCLMICCISLPCSRMGIRSFILEMSQTQKTVDMMRQDKTLSGGLERISMYKDIMDHNNVLASEKYYNHTVFDIWIPDEIENVQPIR